MLRSPILIREAKQTDVKSAIDIDDEVFTPYGTAENPEIIQSRFDIFPEGFIVAERNSKIIGFGTSERWLAEREPVMNERPIDSHHPQGQVFCITAMAVQRSSWGEGIGSALLDRFIHLAQMQQRTVIVLETTRARRFYEKFGFQCIGERNQATANLFIMRLRL